MLPRLLVLSVCLTVCVAQRSRARTRSGYQADLQSSPSSSSASSASRALFEEPQTSSSFDTQSFFPEFDWSDPSFADMGSIPEWGMKKRQPQAPAPALEEELQSDRQGGYFAKK